jgi:hypothetical protein
MKKVIVIKGGPPNTNMPKSASRPSLALLPGPRQPDITRG